MRLFLQQHPSAGEPPRYLQLTLQPDLFGGWELLRETGQIGGRGQLRREQYLAQPEATAAFEKLRDAHLKRGFQVMFVRGADAPR
ncbi:MAG: WGR domain-containing protein [Pseudoxanthomonas sp.]|jgi:predicted DNA-binding WGR domain protein